MDDFLETNESYNTRLGSEALKKAAQKEEAKFLSILIRDKDCLSDCMAVKMKPGTHGHFWDMEARTLFGIVHGYYEKHQSILTRSAVDTVMDSIDKAVNGFTIDEEHRAKIRMYWDKVNSLQTPVEDYAQLKTNINNRFVQWQAFEIMKEEIDRIKSASNNQEEVVQKAKDRFNGIEGMEADKYMLTVDMKGAMDDVGVHITKRRENPESTRVIMSGIKAIDDMYHGFPPCSYTIITGMINGGKTTLMFNLAFNMAKMGYNVVYVSLEKEAISLFIRLTALHALVDYNRIKIGGKKDAGLSDYFYKKLMSAVDDIKTKIQPKFTCIQAAQGVSLPKLLAEVDKVKRHTKIDVLFVDYLGCIRPARSYPGRPDLDEAHMSQELQAYGRNNRFVTITASQLKTPSSKEIRGRARKATAEDASSVEVNTEDLAGSKMIIADADAAMGVILNNDKPPTKMFIFGTKARDDESRRTVILDFDGKIGRVSDPVFEPGQITDVDQMVYNAAITEESLRTGDDLFKEDLTGPAATTIPKKEKHEEVIETSSELNDNDFESVANNNSKAKTSTPAPKADDLDIFGEA